MSEVRLTVRIDFGADGALGPGKVRLLEAIHKTGSISQAGRSLGMSYRRAWLLVDDLNQCFREPVVTTQPGGVRGGGAALTRFGRELIKRYRSIETQATTVAKRQMHDLKDALRTGTRPVSKRLKTSIPGSKSRR
jgi:molybdate transport system regulatory protein